jgi:hypothetical protein
LALVLTFAAPATASSQPFTALSCAAGTTACTAVAPSGQATTRNGRGWSAARAIDPAAMSGAGALSGVSCGSPSLCVAFDGQTGEVITGRSGVWSSPAPIEPDGGGIQALSCTSSTFCEAVDYAGQALSFNGSAWSQPGSVYTAGTVAALSCASRSFCLAGDDLGNVAAFGAAGWGAPTALSATNTQVTAVACAATGSCVAGVGSTLTTLSRGRWSKPTRVHGAGITAVSCASKSLCLALAGGVIAGPRKWRRVSAKLTGRDQIAVSCGRSTCVVLDAGGAVVRLAGGTWRSLGAVPGGRPFRPAQAGKRA